MTSKVMKVAVGDTLPAFVRETGFANWNRYAAVNDEFIDIHMDDDAGRAAGYDSAFGMGNLLWAYLHNLLRQWMGPADRILSLECQFRGPNTKGMKVAAQAQVTAIRETDGGHEIDLDIWIEDESGNKLTPGRATVLVVS